MIDQKRISAEIRLFKYNIIIRFAIKHKLDLAQLSNCQFPIIYNLLE